MAPPSSSSVEHDSEFSRCRWTAFNPEEAVHAYGELGGHGVMAAMHWGTFRLTDEDPLEPPRRTRIAWRTGRYPAGDLWIPAHGESKVIRSS